MIVIEVDPELEIGAVVLLIRKGSCDPDIGKIVGKKWYANDRLFYIIELYEAKAEYEFHRDDFYHPFPQRFWRWFYKGLTE